MITTTNVAKTYQKPTLGELPKQNLTPDVSRPLFHGCNQAGLCEFSSVCDAHTDGFMVFQKDKNRTLFDHTWGNLSHYTPPRRPVLVDYQEYLQSTNVQIFKNVFVLNCWKQAASSTNPAHLLTGVGKLFAEAEGSYSVHV